jgi:hypothetical protein
MSQPSQQIVDCVLTPLSKPSQAQIMALFIPVRSNRAQAEEIKSVINFIIYILGIYQKSRIVRPYGKSFFFFGGTGV